MADLAHLVGADRTINSVGDLATVDLADWTKQRILRRLLTNAGGYIWQLNYGAGLPGMVGATISSQQIAAIIRQQLGLEAAVSKYPEPQVSVQADQIATVFATVTYKDVSTASSEIFDVPGNS